MIKAVYLVLVCLIPFSYAETFRFVDSTFCPLICDPNDNGDREGFLIDIMRDALASEGHQLSFNVVLYKRALSLVENGMADGLPAVYQSDAPALLYGNSVFYPGRNQLFVRGDSDLRILRDKPWDGLRLAVVSGYTFGNSELDAFLLEQQSINSSLVTAIDGPDPYRRMLLMLEHKRIDAIIDDRAFVYYSLQRYNQEKSDGDDLVIKSIADISSGENVIAYNPKNIARSNLLINILDPYIESLYQSGDINKYLEPYGLEIESD